MKNKLPFAVYQTDGITLAKRLLGCRLVHETPEGRCGGIIVETEAYMGLTDDAAHSYRGNPNGRVNVQYGPGGFAYIYLIYGLHWLFNIVTGEKDFPQAVLIRALEKPWDGPAKWTRAFSVTGAQNGIYLPDSEEIWLEEGNALSYTAAPRVGIDYAREPWKSIPWRFIAAEGGK